MAYLLRLWQVRDERHVGWRASLENAHTGKRRGFASLDELFAFVRRQTGGMCNTVSDVEEEEE
jgi:hypothetical protein